MWFLALKALPWRLILLGVVITSAAGYAMHALHSFGAKEFERGKAEVQLRWDVAEHKRTLMANEAEQRMAAEASVRQAAVDRLSQEQLQTFTATKAALDAAVTSGARLRATIAALTDAHRPSVTSPTATPGDLDGAAVAFGKLLGTCSAMAERSGGQAEGLAVQLRGLQAYVQTVIEPEGIRAK